MIIAAFDWIIARGLGKLFGTLIAGALGLVAVSGYFEYQGVQHQKAHQAKADEHAKRQANEARRKVKTPKAGKKEPRDGFARD